MSKVLRFIRWFPVALFVFLLACSDSSTNPFKFEDLNKTPVGNVVHQVIRSGFRTASYSFSPEEPRYFSELLAGQYDQYSSSFAIRFANLLDRIDSVSVKSADLLLHYRYRIPVSSDSMVRLSIHPITQVWEETTVNLEELATQYEADPIAEPEVGIDSTGILQLALPVAYVQDVIYRRRENTGLLIKNLTPGKIVAFDSDELASGPAIRIRYDKEGKTDSVTVTATEGVSLFQSGFQLPEDRLVVGNEDFFATFVYFDHESIPQYATVNNAYLTLVLDRENSFYPENHANVFSILAAGTDNWDIELGQVDSSRVDTTHFLGGKEVRIDVTSFLQRWVNGEAENHGLRITPRYLGNEFFRLLFFTEAAQDSTRRPRLDVFYTQPANFSK